jgi:hypothetical protein
MAQLKADSKRPVALPSNGSSSAEQMPNLKLIQLSSAGYAHYEATPFYKSFPEDSKLICANASGIHVVRL